MSLNLVFGRAFHLILMHFFCYIQCFEVSFSKIWFFSQKAVFPEFRLIQSIFWSIEIFRSIEDRISGFFKTILWLFQKQPFQKVFQLFFSLRLGKDSLQFFVIFLQNFCNVFLSQGRYDHSIPPFCFIFMISCIFSCI